MGGTPLGLALAGLLFAVPARGAEELRNWFNDPFLKVRASMADCPLPAGPFTDHKDFLAQSHRRAEKGTTAWLAGEAERPKAYAYDAEIAAALTSAFRDSAAFEPAALWVTVQGRVVYIEGCVAARVNPSDLERFVHRVPDVQQAIAVVRAGPAAKVPYRVMPPQPAGSAPAK